jgi:hypothetical protein
LNGHKKAQQEIMSQFRGTTRKPSNIYLASQKKEKREWVEN